MANSIRVMCINKSDRLNPYERILYIGGVGPDGKRWKISQQQTIEYIETKKFSFYVVVNSLQTNVIVAKSQFGHKYLKTEADSEGVNNLLSLPECP